MQCEVETSAGVFVYTLRRAERARHLTISVAPGGGIVATAPIRISEREIEQFFVARAMRIARAVARLRRAPKPIPLPPATVAERAALEAKLALFVPRAARLLGLPETPPFTVRVMCSRFGSCSARGALSFSDTLRALPEHLFWYVVIHEAAHCLEHNHAPAFWAIVEKVIHNSRAQRRELRKYHFVR